MHVSRATQLQHAGGHPILRQVGAAGCQQVAYASCLRAACVVACCWCGCICRLPTVGAGCFFMLPAVGAGCFCALPAGLGEAAHQQSRSAEQLDTYNLSTLTFCLCRMVIFGTLLTAVSKPMFALSGAVYTALGITACLSWITFAKVGPGLARAGRGLGGAAEAGPTNHPSLSTTAPVSGYTQPLNPE